MVAGGEGRRLNGTTATSAGDCVCGGASPFFRSGGPIFIFGGEFADGQAIRVLKFQLHWCSKESTGWALVSLLNGSVPFSLIRFEYPGVLR
jgi:hypothetical protein